MRFDIVDLRLFVAIVEVGSITHGAARVNLALGSASGRIKQMEEAVGVPLLARQRLGVRPTEAGQTLLRHARTTLASMQRLTDDLDQFAHGLRGTVRLLANTNALLEFLPSPIGRYLVDHPNVSVELAEKPSHDIVDAIVDGAADIGVVAATADVGALQSFPFADDRLCAIVPAIQSRFTGITKIHFEELLDCNFVGYSADAAIQVFLEKHAHDLHRQIRHRIQLSNFEAICRLVENGVGVSVIPESAARRYKRTMGIRILRLEDQWALREMRVCVAEREGMAMYAQQLLDDLIAFGTKKGVKR